MPPYFDLADFRELGQILERCLVGVAPAGWQRFTESGNKGWTMHQTLAHLVAIAELYQKAIECAIYDRPFVHPGLDKREDLGAMNEQEIAKRLAVAPAGLMAQLLATFEQTANLAATFAPSDWERVVAVAAYNRPVSVKILVGAQLAHVGFVHAAQITRPIPAKPLWVQYRPELRQRFITHFFGIMSYAYWPERGNGLQAAINFVADGHCWFVEMNPAGGHSGPGKHPKANLTLRFSSAHSLAQTFTGELSPWWAALSGRVLGWGNLPLAFRLPQLFTPA